MTRTLIVTGASRGIGRHIGERATQEGWRVIGLARRQDEAAPFEMRHCDVSNPTAWEAAVSDLRRDSTLYGLVNSAGIASMNLVMAMTPETIARIVAVNLLGTIYGCRQVGKYLARNKQGRIINFSTLAVTIAIKGEAVYAASKAGVEAFSRSFAREMSDHGVTVNTIAPGPIDTDLIAKVPKDKIDAAVGRQLIPRAGTPEDVWRLVRMLLSEDSAMMTGDVLHVGGA